MIFIIIVLIIALIGLVGLRKENERELIESSLLISDYLDLKFKHKKLKKSLGSYKGWNTKYKEEIEELEICVESAESLLIIRDSDIKEQSETIKSLNCSLDESYIAINAVGNESNKCKRLELLDKYMNK